MSSAPGLTVSPSAHAFAARAGAMPRGIPALRSPEWKAIVMSEALPNNARRSSRFPIVGNGDGELELPDGMRVGVRIENESAGGFGVFCDADVSVWQNEELLLLRGGDVFEVRVAHVAEVDVPRRDGEPEPEWLPLRIGLERRGLLTARPRKQRRWLGRLVHFDRPGHTSMALTGLFMAAAFVAAPLLWILAMRSRESPFWTAAGNAGDSVLRSVGGWFSSPKRGDEDAHRPAAPWRNSAKEAQRSADAAKKELQALLAPLRDKAKAALGSAGRWLESTARNASREAAAVQDTAAGGAERLVDAGGDAFDTLIEQWESGEFLDHWDAAVDPWSAALEQWNAEVEQAQVDRSGLPAGSPRAAPPPDDAPADDASMETSNGPIEGAATTLKPTPPAPSKPPPAAKPAR